MPRHLSHHSAELRRLPLARLLFPLGHVPELLAPALLRISDGLAQVQKGAIREQRELVALRTELARARGGVEAAEASIAEEGKVRSALESDAADVAESLLEADLTMCVCFAPSREFPCAWCV